MTISDQQLAAVMESFNLARAEDEFVSNPARFYELLFQRAPALRGMFRDDLSGQGMKFMSTLKSIVVALRDSEALERELRPLGESHAAIGVLATHFVPMGEALIDTLKEELGTRFTEEMETAWRVAFAAISDEMIARGGING